MVAWVLENHVCAVCCGRVVSQKSDDGKIYRCSNCGHQGIGRVGAVCCCGIKIRSRNAGIRCMPNPEVTPEWPSEIVAKQVDGVLT